MAYKWWGKMEINSEALQNAKIQAKLYDEAKKLSEDEQLCLLDIVKVLKYQLSRDKINPYNTGKQCRCSIHLQNACLKCFSIYFVNKTLFLSSMVLYKVMLSVLICHLATIP